MEEQERLTLEEWEELVIKLDFAFRRAVCANQKELADDLLATLTDVTSEVNPGWTST